MRKVSAEWIQARCPRWITQEEVDPILATPQNDIGDGIYSVVSDM